MAEEKVEFELVSPERLLVSRAVDMVVVPGEEGDFGVLPRHAPLISTLRPGVIQIYENQQVVERIFVASGVAEVTPERCTVLAEQAIPVAELDRAAYEQQLRSGQEEVANAKSEAERERAARKVAVAEAVLQLKA